MARPLDADEEARAGLLARCGLVASAARAYVALQRGPGLGAQEIAAATGLGRQEAARAGRELELAGLARVEKVPTSGRPALRYHVAKEGLAALLTRRRAQIADELAALEALARDASSG